MKHQTFEPWYSARCIFRHTGPEAEIGKGIALYEERIVLVRAVDFDDARRRAKEEALTYASSGDDVEYIDCVDVYHLFDRTIGDLTEVFSLLRYTDLNGAEYVSSFFRTGTECADAPDSEQA